jgi:integrase
LNKLDGLPEDAPLCQSLSQRSVASLSNEFSNLLNKAGIDTGKFEANGRARNRKTFHSLRSSFCSDLARRGVPQDLRMLMAGHRTASAHKGYVHQSASDVAARMAPFFQPTSTKP